MHAREFCGERCGDHRLGTTHVLLFVARFTCFSSIWAIDGPGIAGDVCSLPVIHGSMLSVAMGLDESCRQKCSLGAEVMRRMRGQPGGMGARAEGLVPVDVGNWGPARQTGCRHLLVNVTDEFLGRCYGSKSIASFRLGGGQRLLRLTRRRVRVF